MGERRKRTSGTLVVGMGRFGSAVAVTLDRLGFEVLAMEKKADRVQHLMGVVPIVQGNGADLDALEEIGASEFSAAVVGTGSSLEASVLITANLVDLGIANIWAKAISREHGRILRRIGAHHVVYPEYDAGQRTAHLIGGHLLDYIELDKQNFVIAKMHPPKELDGRVMKDVQLRSRHGVNLIGVLKKGEPFQYADEDTPVFLEDLIVVSGPSKDVIRFSNRPR